MFILGFKDAYLMDNSNCLEEVEKIFSTLGDVILRCLKYELCEKEYLDEAFEYVDCIRKDPVAQKLYMEHFDDGGKQSILFYFSNIVYGLKTKSDLDMSEKTFLWLTSVWKNFLERNRSYNEYVDLSKSYDDLFSSLLGYDRTCISKLTHVAEVKNYFIGKGNTVKSHLDDLEKFYIASSEIAAVMKPSYFFFTDLAKEIKIKTDETVEGAIEIEQRGLANFGSEDCNYFTVIGNTCYSTLLLEAVYLFLKTRKNFTSFKVIDGKKKFITTADVYKYYSTKLIEHQREFLKLLKSQRT